MTDILFIADTQHDPCQSMEHMTALGRFAWDRKPDHIVHGGDVRDFASLSRYDSAVRKAVEARDIMADVQAGNEGFEAFEEPIRENNRKQNNRNRYRPERWITEGNHDKRLWDFLAENPEFRGLFPESLFAENRLGWKTIPFLEPLTIEGVSFAHYWALGPNGDVTNGKNGAPSAKEQVKRLGRSCVGAHRQGCDYSTFPRVDRLTHGLILGSFYPNHMEYKTRQGDAYFRGCALLHDVEDGDFDLELISLRRLLRRYGS